jgi:hypothetical protein
LTGLLPAAAQDMFGPFQVDPGSETIRFDGEIDAGAALNFRRALKAAPNAKRLVLNSPGGLVPIALLIADDVDQRGLATVIPPGAQCYSACSYIFLAGQERDAQGELGVHQISSDSADLESAQITISDIIDVLNRFDTPTEVLTVMFRTPPNKMYVFSASEVSRFGINRGAVASESGTEASGETGPATSDRSGAGPPARVAVYVGLDFYGGDIGSARSPDLETCASQCLSAETCRAFTFNSDKRARRGPNCFMKNGRSRPDGNAAAISGVLLQPSEPDPEPLEVGVIDPRFGIAKDRDFPFRDFVRQARDRCQDGSAMPNGVRGKATVRSFHIRASEGSMLAESRDGGR